MSQPPYGNQPPYGGQPPFGGQPPQGGQPPYGGQPNPGDSQAPWGQPGPGSAPGYGQPPTGNLPSYAQPTEAFAQPTPAFGQPGPGGGGYGGPPGGQPPYGGGPGSPYGAPPPSKKSPLPFIIGGLVLLLVAGGIGLYFILKDDTPTPVATPPTVQTTESTESTEDTADPTEDTESSTEDTGSPGGDEPNFPESEDFAIEFVQLMVDGDYPTALTLLCADGQDASDGDGFADPQALADDFFLELGATTVTGGETTDVTAAPDATDRDIVTFDLETDVGTVALEVQVLDEDLDLTICGYDSL